MISQAIPVFRDAACAALSSLTTPKAAKSPHAQNSDERRDLPDSSKIKNRDISNI
jgi:hypothetical protein